MSIICVTCGNVADAPGRLPANAEIERLRAALELVRRVVDVAATYAGEPEQTTRIPHALARLCADIQPDIAVALNEGAPLYVSRLAEGIESPTVSAGQSAAETIERLTEERDAAWADLARENVPALLAELQRLRAERDAAEILRRTEFAARERADKLHDLLQRAESCVAFTANEMERRLMEGAKAARILLAEIQCQLAATAPERCAFACPHLDRCTLDDGHDGGHNHRGCDCNEHDHERGAIIAEAPRTHDVTSCRDCAYVFGEPGDYSCTHPDVHSADIGSAAPPAPPSWCPLRERPVVVRLRC